MTIYKGGIEAVHNLAHLAIGAWPHAALFEMCQVRDDVVEVLARFLIPYCVADASPGFAIGLQDEWLAVVASEVERWQDGGGTLHYDTEPLTTLLRSLDHLPSSIVDTAWRLGGGRAVRALAEKPDPVSQG